MDEKTFRRVSNFRGCIIDRKGKFVFLSNNKVAQTSIARGVLADRSVIKKDNTLIWNYYRLKIIKQWSSVSPFVFTIVRNPYDKVYSAFCYLVKIGKIKGISFNDYVTYYISEGLDDLDPHFGLQSKWGVEMSSLGIDFIGRFENLENDWRYISSMIGSNGNLPHSNISTKANEYLNVYTDQSKAVIRDIYDIDFKEFGYD